VRRGPFGEHPTCSIAAPSAVAIINCHIYIPEADDRSACATFSPRCPASARLYATKRGRDPTRSRALRHLIALSEAGRVVRRIRSGSTTAPRRTTPARWTFIASRATTRASCFSIQRLRLAEGASGVAVVAEKSLGFIARCSTWSPLDASLVRGSHGLVATIRTRGPLLLADGPAPSEALLPMTRCAIRALAALDLAEE